MEHLRTYAAAAEWPCEWEASRGRYFALDNDGYIEAVGGAERITGIPPTVF